MSETVRTSPFIRSILSAVAFAFAVAIACADETWVVGGARYENVRILARDAGSVTIAHRQGITQLELATLAPDLQQRLAYDRSAGESWRQQAGEELRATAQVAREQEQQRIRKARDAAPPSARPSSARDTSSEPAATPIQVELRAEVDLRADYASHGLYFKSQGRRPSCAIFAAVSAIEFELAQSEGLPGPLSEEFVIWAVRDLHPGTPIDDGYHFPEVMAAIQAHGIATQKLMPNTFGIPLHRIKPDSQARFDASQRRDIMPVWYRRDDPALLARLVHALNLRKPVVVGVRWPHWRTLQQNNLLRDQKPAAGGGHAVTLIGYRCPAGSVENLVFLFRNSYGTDWGMGGCGFMAADYLRQHFLGAFHVTTREQLTSAASL